MEFFRGYDRANPDQGAHLEGISDFHVHEFEFYPGELSLYIPEVHYQIICTPVTKLYYRKETNDERQIVYYFYPETANLTLEQIDYLFIDEGLDGVHGSSQPSSQPDLHPDAKEPTVREVHCTV